MYRVGYDVKNVIRRQEETSWVPGKISSFLIGATVTVFYGYVFAVCLTGF